MAIFQIYGGSATDEVAAFGNGLTLAVVSEPLCSLCYCCMGYATVQDARCSDALPGLRDPARHACRTARIKA